MLAQMGERLQFGDRGAGEVFVPRGTGAVAAVIVCHEWFGLNDETRLVAQRLASDGYLVVAPDFFDGRVTRDPAEASRLAEELKTPAALDLLSGAVDALVRHPRCNGRIGVIGFSMGGGLALAAASNVPGLSAVVSFYGLPKPKYFDAGKVTAAVQGHYARQDTIVPRERVEAIWTELMATPAESQLFFYEAGHAFMRETDPARYEPEDAEVAWARTQAFFRRHLIEAP